VLWCVQLPTVSFEPSKRQDLTPPPPHFQKRERERTFTKSTSNWVIRVERTYFTKTVNKTHATVSYLFPCTLLQSSNILACLQAQLKKILNLFTFSFYIFTIFKAYTIYKVHNNPFLRIFRYLYNLLLHSKVDILHLLQC